VHVAETMRTERASIVGLLADDGRLEAGSDGAALGELDLSLTEPVTST
jgi:hypothetical protein